jgi:hypothetical protein
MFSCGDEHRTKVIRFSMGLKQERSKKNHFYGNNHGGKMIDFLCFVKKDK